MTLQFQPLIPNPEMSDLLRALKSDIFLNLNCHAIGTVQSVNTTAGTLVAQINYCKTFFQQDDTGAYVPVNQNYAPLADIPFIVLGGGTSNLTFPIAKGDQCLILFNDRDLDNWFAGPKPPTPIPNQGMGGSTMPQVASNRLHSIADGIALVGLNLVSSYDSDRVLLTNGTTKVGFNPNTNKVTITNGQSLGSILSTIFTNLNTVFLSLSTAMGSLGQTAAATACTNAATAATTAASNIGSLLE